MPSRNITVPVSDYSPQAIGRTREPETHERAGSVPMPSGQNLAGKQRKTARLPCLPASCGISCFGTRMANFRPPFKEAVEVLVCRVGPGLAMLVSKRKTKVLVCIGLQLQVHGSA
jgi:hypothetical protein